MKANIKGVFQWRPSFFYLLDFGLFLTGISLSETIPKRLNMDKLFCKFKDSLHTTQYTARHLAVVCVYQTYSFICTENCVVFAYATISRGKSTLFSEKIPSDIAVFSEKCYFKQFPGLLHSQRKLVSNLILW